MTKKIPCLSIDKHTGKPCTEKASYGLLSDGHMIACKEHATAGMILLKYKHCVKCKEDGIIPYPRRAHLAPFGESSKYCKPCADELGIEVKNSTVRYCKCGKFATFGVKGTKLRLTCADHAEPEYVCLSAKMCEICKDKIATFAEIGQTKIKYCAGCARENEIAVYAKKRDFCNFVGCTSTKHYGSLGKPAEFCEKHKEKNMVRTYGLCKHLYDDGSRCTTIAKFNLPEETGGIYCSVHAKENMINMYTKACQDGECNLIPVFNYSGESKGIYCFKHKMPEMVDVNAIKCLKCGAHAHYGKPGYPATSCGTCKEPGMLINPNARCKIIGCNQRAYWGKKFIMSYCEEHKAEDDQNYAERPCSSCGLDYVLNEIGLCELCDPQSFKKYALAKQKSLVDYLLSNGFEPTSVDKSIYHSECGKERPDIVFEYHDRVLIVECDEFQHKGRNCVCEQTRMVNISQAYGGLPVIFIRFNPDNYRSHGVNFGMAKRYELLGKMIDDFNENKLNYPKNSLCSVIYLFYDDWTRLENEDWESLLNYEEDSEIIIYKKKDGIIIKKIIRVIDGIEVIIISKYKKYPHSDIVII